MNANWKLTKNPLKDNKCMRKRANKHRKNLYLQDLYGTFEDTYTTD